MNEKMGAKKKNWLPHAQVEAEFFKVEQLLEVDNNSLRRTGYFNPVTVPLLLLTGNR
jgi:hypothetical protein